MRTSFLCAGVAAIAVAANAAVELPAARLTRGGTTFDFAKLSADRFASAFDPERNLLTNAPAGRIVGTVNYAFKVPRTNGGRWRLSCRYRFVRARPEAEMGAIFRVSPGGYSSYHALETGHEWGMLSDVATLEPGADTVRLMLRAPGKENAVFEIKDMTLTDETPQAPIELRGTTWERLDGAFAVPEGQCVAVEMVWRKSDPQVAYAAKDFTARVELPPGIEYVGASYADPATVRTERRDDGSSVTTFGFARNAPMPGSKHVTWNTLVTLVRGARKAGRCGQGSVVIVCRRDDRTFETRSSPIDFRVTPRITAQVPRHYQNGCLPGNSLCRMAEADPAAACAAVQSMTEFGVTWLADAPSPNVYAAWRQAGIRTITPNVHHMVDGYVIGPRHIRPDDIRFVSMEPGSDRQTLSGEAVCPVTIYEGSAYLTNSVVPTIRKLLQAADGAWVNWEPARFFGRGCFCDRCCRKFAEHLGQPYAEVRAKWPNAVRKQGEWHAQWQEFRSLQLAAVTKACDRIVAEATAGGRSIGLIPGVAWVEMSSWWRPRNYPAEGRAIDYAGGMRWMCPWGPYAAWESDSPYMPAKRKPLCHFFAAKDVRATVDADYPADRRPKLMALPQGHQCGGWLTQPEWLGMALDSYFFHRFEATLAYFFPRGYDARYWERYADATTRAAKYEPFVLSGQLADGRIAVEPASSAYATPCRRISGWLPDERDCSLLQTVAYERDGRVIVAAMNFWERGEAFFRLKVAGLGPTVTIVDEHGVLRAEDRRQPTWSGAELAAQGVELVVPAQRTVVFEFRPGKDAADARSVLTDGQLRDYFRQRRDELEREAAKDAADEALRGPLKKDYMPNI